jgi:hypothetical protein
MARPFDEEQDMYDQEMQDQLDAERQMKLDAAPQTSIDDEYTSGIKNNFTSKTLDSIFLGKDFSASRPDKSDTDAHANPIVNFRGGALTTPPVDTEKRYPLTDKAFLPENSELNKLLMPFKNGQLTPQFGGRSFGPKDLLRNPEDVEQLPPNAASNKIALAKAMASEPAITGAPADLSDKEMEDALAADAEDKKMRAIIGGANRFGAALARTKYDEGFDKTLQDMAPHQATDLKTLRAGLSEKLTLEQEKKMSDPNSSVSNTARVMMKSMLEKSGYGALAAKITPNMSAREIDAQFGKANIQNLMQQYEAIQARRDIAKLKGDSHNNEMQQKAYTDLNNKMRAPRDPGVRLAMTNRELVDNANSMLTTYSRGVDKDAVPETIVNAINMAILRIETGGIPSGSKLKMVSPETFRAKWNTFLSKVNSKPTGAQMGEFLQQNSNYLGALKQNAEDAINEYESDTYRGYKNRLSPADRSDLEQDKPHLAEKSIAPVSNQGSYSPEIEKNIRSFMEAHPELSKDEALKVLRAAGKIK